MSASSSGVASLHSSAASVVVSAGLTPRARPSSCSPSSRPSSWAARPAARDGRRRGLNTARRVRERVDAREVRPWGRVLAPWVAHRRGSRRPARAGDLRPAGGRSASSGSFARTFDSEVSSMSSTAGAGFVPARRERMLVSEPGSLWAPRPHYFDATRLRLPLARCDRVVRPSASSRTRPLVTVPFSDLQCGQVLPLLTVGEGIATGHAPAAAWRGPPRGRRARPAAAARPP